MNETVKPTAPTRLRKKTSWPALKLPLSNLASRPLKKNQERQATCKKLLYICFD